VHTGFWIAVALLGVSATLYLAGIASLFLAMRRRGCLTPAALPALTICKPLKGLEEELEQNLESVFTQVYPGRLAIVLGSLEPDDPALEVARRVARRHPDVPSRVVAGGPPFGHNPKVTNLANLLRHTRTELVLFSDANVRVGSRYVAQVVAELQASGAALLTSLVAGVGEKSAGAAMDNLHLTAFVSPAMCFALQAARITCVVGKTMLLRRSDLEEIGGLELVKDVLAEDFVLGEAYQKAGKRVLLSATPVQNVNIEQTVDRFMSRHARWLRMRAVISMPGMVADLAANPVAMGVLAVVVSGFDPRLALALAGIFAAKPFFDGLAVRRLRGTPMAVRHLLLTPVKDLLVAAVWPYALLSRSVEWRGVRMHIGRGSRVIPVGEPAAAPAVRTAE
jgi:ceramide glucosyltransferase